MRVMCRIPASGGTRKGGDSGEPEEGGGLGFWDRLLWELGFAICHQWPESLLRFGDRPLFVCARDTGIFVSFFALLLALSLLSREKRGGMPPPAVLLVCLGGVSFLVWDGLTSYLGWRETTNLLRFLSGAAGGAGIAVPVAALVNREVWGGDTGLCLLGGGRDLFRALVALSASLFPYLLRPGFIFRLAQLWLLVSILGTIWSLNLVLVCVIRPPREKGKPGWLYAVALLLLPLEMAASYGLHRALAGEGPAFRALAAFP